MKLKIYTPEATVLDQEVDSVTLPGSVGEMTILPTHTALVATLGKGELYFRSHEKKVGGYFIDGGFVEVLRDQITLMTKVARTSESTPSTH